MNAVYNGIDRQDALWLFRECDFRALAKAADEVNRLVTGDTVTFVNNLVVNYTNICVGRCPLCAFYVDYNDEGAYVRDPIQVAKAVVEARAKFGIEELHYNGGLNPDLTIEYFEETFRLVKKYAPDVTIKGLTAAEIHFYSVKWRMSYKEVLERLKDAGMDALSGGGAEVLVDEVRRAIAPFKASSAEWLRIHEEAHRLGLRSNATMLYGHIERPEHVIEHLFKVKELQERTGGFLLFIPVKFVPWNTRLYKEGLVKGPAPAEYDVRIFAISRIVLYNAIERIGVYWVSVGKRLSSTLLLAGGNDLVGTMINEEVLNKAGARQTASIEELAVIAREAGKRPFLRDTFHKRLREI